MKNNGGKINLLGANAPQIKVNLNNNNANINSNELPIFPENSQYENINSNDYFLEKIKNVKYQQYIDPDTYSNQSIFTEYDSLPKNIMNPSEIYKLGNLSINDFKMIYNNTNGNRNKEKKLISKNSNRQYRFTSNDNYANRQLIKQRKTISSNKANNKLIPIKNIYNNNSMNPPMTTNKKTNLKIGTKLNIFKSEIQYPLNHIRNFPINKYSSYNNTDIKDVNSEEETNIKNPIKAHSKNKNNDMGKLYKSSMNNLNENSNKKTIKQNKSNYGYINRRNNNDFKSPVPIDNNYISTNKLITNFNTFSKNENDSVNSYNSSYNFYHKDARNNSRKNEKNLKFHNTMNNFGYINTISNSLEDNNRINPVYAHMNNEEIYENDNRKNYINILDRDFQINDTKIKQNNINDINLNAVRHSKGQKSVEIAGNLNNNNEIRFNNILDINKFIQYKKKLLEEFCHCLEEFIFINVKNNFDNFIFKLREYSKQKYFNSLLLKRIQNKSIKKNFFKERSSSSNKTISPSIIPNIISNKRGEFFIPKEYFGRKTFNNYRENISEIIYDDSPRLRKNYRIGKSHGRCEINDNLDNYNSNYNDYYENDSYFYSKGNLFDYENNRYKRINSIEKYNHKYINYNDNTLYVPKKLKHIMSNQLSDKKKILNNNYTNLYPYYNNKNEIKQKKLSPKIDDVNKSHDIDNDMIKAKIIRKNKYNMNYKNNIQDISYDNNYLINKNIENGLLNTINNNTNKNAAPIEKIKKEKTNQVYKKKIKITKIKSKIIKNKILSNNNSNNLIKQNKEEKNIKKENELNIQVQNINKLEEIKEQKIELSNVNNKNNNDKKENKIDSNQNLTDDKKDIKEITTKKNNTNNKIADVHNKNKEKSDENGNNININKKIEENNNKLNDINNQKEMKEINENKTNEQNNSINENNRSNGNNIINEDIEESEENITREIIVKDVSTSDKRLNVFIKYIEIPKIQPEPNKTSYNYFNPHSLILFQTDSIYLPALYPHKYNYYNYYYGTSNDKNNKLKLHKILSSIIEEEEKSKVAGSVNNSIISEEENNGNYSHFFIQSIKYVTNFLQSIFDDKKKDIFFKFFKILKRMKNEAFLKGLIDQKKMQTLNKLKEDNEEENENNTSGDVILYNVNDNFNVDIDYFGSKSNDRKDISRIRNKNIKSENKHKVDEKKKEKIKKEENCKNNEKTISDKKYSSGTNLQKFKDDIFDLNDNNKLNLSMEIDKKDIDKKKVDDKNKGEDNKKEVIIENLKINDYNEKDNENGNNMNENEKIKENERKDSELNVDYEKNVTISEACRGLSDVILDFKIYLVKFCLKNKKSSK